MTDTAALNAPKIVGFTPLRPLGTGGFSQVYLYEEDFPRRLVAVKVLTGDYRSERARTAFEAEVNTMAQLSNHPSVVSVFGAGVAVTGQPYIALEYCPGSFREKTRHTPANLFEVLDAGVRLAGALESAHRAHLLHRDIKPSNVLITVAGRPVLSDFGIALRESAAHNGSPSRQIHAFSIPWSAPEVVTRQTTGTVASEVWGLGATLYTFAAGYSPFEISQPGRNTPELLTRRITQGVYRPLETAGFERLNAVLFHAMRVMPTQRIASMKDFGKALQQVQRDSGFPVTPMDIVQEGWSGPGSDSVATPPMTQQTAPERGQITTRSERRAALSAQSTQRLDPGAAAPQRSRTLGVTLGSVGATLVTVGAAVWGAFAMGWL